MIERQLNVFVLVLIVVVFIVSLAIVEPTAIACRSGPYVQVPWAANSAFLTESEADLEIVLTADHRVFIGRSVIPLDHLQSELESIAVVTPHRRLLIRADGTVPYGWLADLIRAARYAGFDRLTLITFRGTPLEAYQRGGA